MLKEIKYLIFIFLICLFIFFTSKYYFSDVNKKKSYRSYKSINNKVIEFSKNLPILESNTVNIVEYINQNKDNKKKFNFWKLLEKNE